jgi:sulfopropanediol 3-dehydrogenase
MAIQYLKKAAKQPTSGEADTRRIVGEILEKIREGGEKRVRRYAADFDKWEGEIVVSRDAIQAAAAKLPQRLKEDIDFAYRRVRDFAERQRQSVREFEVELLKSTEGVTVADLQTGMKELSREAIEALANDERE